MKRTIFLLSLLLALTIAGLAQSGSSSVMIYPQGTEGTIDGGSASAVANMIATEMFKRFPCAMNQ